MEQSHGLARQSRLVKRAVDAPFSNLADLLPLCTSGGGDGRRMAELHGSISSLGGDRSVFRSSYGWVWRDPIGLPHSVGRIPSAGTFHLDVIGSGPDLLPMIGIPHAIFNVVPTSK